MKLRINEYNMYIIENIDFWIVSLIGPQSVMLSCYNANTQYQRILHWDMMFWYIMTGTSRPLNIG